MADWIEKLKKEDEERASRDRRDLAMQTAITQFALTAMPELGRAIEAEVNRGLAEFNLHSQINHTDLGTGWRMIGTTGYPLAKMEYLVSGSRLSWKLTQQESALASKTITEGVIEPRADIDHKHWFEKDGAHWTMGQVVDFILTPTFRAAKQLPQR